MKIGIVTTWFERGAAYVSKAFKESLEQSGDVVVIYARGGESTGEGDPVWDGDYVTWGKNTSFPILSYTDSKDFSKWLDKESPDVVIFNEQRWFETILECRKRNIKVGAYIDYYTQDMVPTFSIYDFLICNTKKHYSVFSWHSQCYYIPWGTDTNVYKPLDFNKTERVFFHSAGMNPYRKGTDLTILSFKDALLKTKEIPVKKCKLLIHTQIDSLEDFFDNQSSIQNSQEISSALKWLAENDHLEIVNKTVTAPGLYSRGDIYLYPSRLDGLGLTVAEAISSGLPTIVPNDGPMNEFVIPEKTGSVCEVERYIARFDGYYWPQNQVNLIDFSSAIVDYMQMSDLELASMKETCRNYALSQLNYKTNLETLSDVIQNSCILDFHDHDRIYRVFKGIDKLFIKYPKITSFLYRIWNRLK